MKIPKITRLPSGSYNCRLRLGGKSYSITAETRQDVKLQAEHLKAVHQLRGPKIRKEMTLREAIDRYIERRPDLSPASVAGYRSVQRTRFQDQMDRSVFEEVDWQQLINEESLKISPKSLANAWGLVSSAILEAGGSLPKVRLPAKKQKDMAFLTAEQLPAFLAAIKGERIEMACLLALHSLRRSELAALRVEDIRGGFIYVERSAVHDEHSRLIYQDRTKTPKSRRKIQIVIPRLATLVKQLPKDGRVVSYSINNITRRLGEICERSGLPKVGLHDLRRTYASLGYHLGLGDMEIMLTGGWSNIQTVRKIYTRLSELDLLESQSQMAAFYQDIANKSTTKTRKGAL